MGNTHNPRWLDWIEAVIATCTSAAFTAAENDKTRTIMMSLLTRLVNGQSITVGQVKVLLANRKIRCGKTFVWNAEAQLTKNQMKTARVRYAHLRATKVPKTDFVTRSEHEELVNTLADLLDGLRREIDALKADRGSPHDPTEVTPASLQSHPRFTPEPHLFHPLTTPVDSEANLCANDCMAESFASTPLTGIEKQEITKRVEIASLKAPVMGLPEASTQLLRNEFNSSSTAISPGFHSGVDWLSDRDARQNRTRSKAQHSLTLFQSDTTKAPNGQLMLDGTDYNIKLGTFESEHDKLHGLDAEFFGLIESTRGGWLRTKERGATGPASRWGASALYAKADPYARQAPAVPNALLIVRWAGDEITGATIWHGESEFDLDPVRHPDGKSIIFKAIRKAA